MSSTPQQLAVMQHCQPVAGRSHVYCLCLLDLLCGCACRSARLSLPLIKSAALLITHADFAGVPATASLDPGAAASGDAATAAVSDAPVASSKAAADADSGSSSFAWGVLQHLKVELKGCGDVLKLLEGVSLLAQLACVPDCSASAIQTVMVMLVNRYPKVRRSWCWAGCQTVSSVCCRTPAPPCCEQHNPVLADGRLAVVSSCGNGLRVGPLGAGDYNQHVQQCDGVPSQEAVGAVRGVVSCAGAQGHG